MQPNLLNHNTNRPHRRRFLVGVTTGAVGLALRNVAYSQIDRSISITPEMLSPEERALVPAFKPPSAAVIKAVRRIDVHHHAVPQAYVDGVSSRTGLSLPLIGWTPEKSLASMDAAGVATAILSIPSNGLWFSDPNENRKLARACNDYMASVVKNHPGRFGFWATLPLTDVQASLLSMNQQSAIGRQNALRLVPHLA
jgi:hypothetical protein